MDTLLESTSVVLIIFITTSSMHIYAYELVLE